MSYDSWGIWLQLQTFRLKHNVYINPAAHHMIRLNSQKCVTYRFVLEQDPESLQAAQERGRPRPPRGRQRHIAARINKVSDYQ